MKNILIAVMVVNVVFTSVIQDPSTSILNGELASVEDYPFFAYLAYGVDNSLLCGGSLIRPDFILTAAHCLVNDDFKVYVGISTLDELKHTEAYSVKRKIPHPSFRNGRSWFDFALIQLETNVTIGARVDVIPLASSYPKVGDIAVVVGFGDVYCNRSYYGAIRCVNSDHLRSVEVEIKQLGYRGTIKSYGTEQNICHGDSGGPMVFDGEVIGISATVDKITCQGGSEFAPVFINSEWIRKHMEDL